MPFQKKIAKKSIEKTFLSVIGEFDEDDLNKAVEENIDLLEKTKKHRPQLLKFGRKMAVRYRKYKDYLNMENLKKWLRKNKRDLYLVIISDPEAERWLEWNMRKFKNYLFEV